MKDACDWFSAGGTAADLIEFVERIPKFDPGAAQYTASEPTVEVTAEGSIEAAASTWPAPLAEAAYHGLAGEIVRAIEPHTEADNVALLLQFLVAFGNAIGRKRYFEADGAKHFPNLFGVLIGATAKGRKGTSWAQVFRLFKNCRTGMGRWTDCGRTCIGRRTHLGRS